MKILVLSSYIGPRNTVRPEAELFIAISKSVKQHLLDHLQIREENVHLIYNGIPETKVVAKEEVNTIKRNLQIEENDFTLLFVGRLAKQKAVHVLLEALCKVIKNSNANIKLIIVGYGVLEQELKTLAKELEIEKSITESIVPLFLSFANVKTP